MTVKSKMITLIILYFLFVTYLAYEGYYLNEIQTYNEFVYYYLNNVQKYLFNITLLTLPVIYVYKTPFLNAELFIRYGNNLFFLIIKKGIVIAITLTIYISILYVFVPILVGYKLQILDILMNNTVGLFSYIFYLYLLYTIIYSINGNEIVGIVATLLFNFIFTISYININFLGEGFHHDQHLQLLNYATAIFNIVGLLFLFYLLRKRKKIK